MKRANKVIELIISHEMLFMGNGYLTSKPEVISLCQLSQSGVRQFYRTFVVRFL